LLTPLSELNKQVRVLVGAGEELVLVLLVELVGNGVVDLLDDGILKEGVLLGWRIETCYCTGAG
jgi:hypothetical protein